MRVVYDNPVLRLEAWPVTGEDGAQAEFVRLRMPDWVTVVAITPDDRVVLVRQPRFGSGAEHLETPGGIVDAGEVPMQAGRRELLEETGFASIDWTPLGAVFPNPALQDNRCHLFVAREVRQVADPRPDPFERLTSHLVPLGDIPRLLSEGTVDHALAVVALQRVLLGV